MHEAPTVFIVDDHPAIRDSIGFLMSSVGLPAVPFETATSFLESYSNDRPGCLILDIRLPGMSGLELQAELNRREFHIPIIFVTGHGDLPIMEHVMQAGAIDCLFKPFNIQQLLERVRQAMELDAKRRCASDFQGDDDGSD